MSDLPLRSKEAICGLRDEELLRMVNIDYDNHNNDALDIAREELKRRGFELLFTRLPPKRAYWFTELWREEREHFKELIKHILRFAMLMISLALTKLLVDQLDYPSDLKEPFEKIHYYGALIIMLIFTASYILKALAFEFAGRKVDAA